MVEQLIISVGQELGRSEAQMQPIIQKLVHEQWFDSIESLREISDEQWVELKLPLRFVERLKARLGAPAQAPAPAASSSSPSEPAATPTQGAAIELSAPPTLSAEPLIDLAKNILQDASLASAPDTMGLLLKIVHAIIKDPKLEKTRKIRLANEAFHKKAGRYESAMRFLRAVGFEEQGEFFIVPVAYISRLTDAHKALSDIVISLGGTPPALPGFNPYCSSISSLGSASGPKGKVAEQRFSEQEQVARAIKEKEALIASGGGDHQVDLNLKVFWQASLGRLEDAVQSAEDVLVDDDEDLALSQLALLKAAVGEGGSFKSREKEQLAKLGKKKVHRVCVIRVVFPNKQVLQLNFHPTTAFADVQAEVEKCLSEECRATNWYLYETPPMRRFQPKITLLKAGLVPGSLLYIGFEVAPPTFLRPDLAAQLPPPPATAPVVSRGQEESRRLAAEAAARRGGPAVAPMPNAWKDQK